MKPLKLIILFFLLANNALAQFTDRFWCFGDSAALNFTNLNAPVASTSVLRAFGSCTSICDSAGNLLFYAATPNPTLYLSVGVDNQGYIINKSNQLMDNGDSLQSQRWYQEMIIVPDPGNKSKSYLFSTKITSNNLGLYYHIIDLNYNGGLGKVVQKNIQLSNLHLYDAIAAVKHGNGRDWWLVVKPLNTTVAVNAFYFYLITPAGISGPLIQNTGTSIRGGGVLRIKFSKDGKKMLQSAPSNLIESYDFDRCTGLLSNVNTIDSDLVVSNQYNWSATFSPDNTKLYTIQIYQGVNQDTSYLFQYDLNAANVLNSVDTLYTFLRPAVPGLLQLGPDDKIYLSVNYEVNDCSFGYLYCDTTYNYINRNICVIKNPNNLGAACNFKPWNVGLGGHRAYVGLPNNPNYELPADSGSICDTLQVGLEQLATPVAHLYVVYFSDWNKAFVNAQKLRGKNYTLDIIDVSGRVVFSENSRLDSDMFTRSVEMSGYASGQYVVSFTTEHEKLTKSFIKE